MIEKYRFGKIVIDGTAYKSDVIILPGEVKTEWRRKNSHSLITEDLSELLAEKPSVLVVGTGYIGMMKIPQATIDEAAARGIEIRAERTGKAVRTLNGLLKEKKNAAGAFHLTC